MDKMDEKGWKAYTDHLNDLGIDPDKWEIENVDDSGSHWGEDHYIVQARSKVNGEYVSYCCIQDFKPGNEWVIVEYSISGN